MDALPGMLRELALYGLVILAFLGPIEAFLRFRLRQATHRDDPRGYLALADPWVTVVIALAGAGTMSVVDRKQPSSRLASPGAQVVRPASGPR